VLGACGDDDKTPATSPGTIAAIVASNDDFDTLETALAAAELTTVFEGDELFTVFAPTDDAFAALPDGALDALLADKDELTAVLKYHVVSGKVDAAAVTSLESATTLEGRDLEFEVIDGAVVINGSVKVTTTDIEASNGIIHVIDAVLLPPEQSSNSIVDVVVNGDDFDTLEAAVVAAELVDTLSGPGPFTVFAPTDAAFEALPAGALDALLADKDALTAVLTYHVVSGELDAAAVSALETAVSLEGSELEIAVEDGKVVINGTVNVVQTDIKADNGIIHVIDAVLTPPEGNTEPPTNTIADIVATHEDFETLETAVVAAELAETLAGPGPFTVFAPTDAAFAALPEGTIEALLADKDALTDILTYHAVAGDVRAATVVTLPRATALNGVDIKVTVVDGKVRLNDSVQVTTTDVIADNGVIHIIDAVLLPPKNLADLVASSTDFSTLATAVTAAGLTGTLSGTDPYTVFAPTNAAIAALGDAVGALLANPAKLNDVILYHVTAGKKYASDVVSSNELTMGNGLKLPVTVTDGVARIGNIVITQTDIYARNGVVHVIDAVLLPPPTIAEAVANDPRFATLEVALGAAGLTETLAGPGPFTVFAPSDAAFALLSPFFVSNLLADVPTLTDALLYHVIDGEVLASEVLGETYLTMKNGAIAPVRTSPASLAGATISSTDIRVRNGVIHVIDAVMLPPLNLAQILGSDPKFSTLLTAVQTAGLAEVLGSGGPFTAFAPDNNAFAKLPAGTVEAVLANPALLTSILLYHVVDGVVPAAAAVELDKATMKNGVELDFTYNPGPMTLDVGPARVTTTDIWARNGVLHVIDTVLVPPTP
jgi:uncharacterized surface protein with fasciclin (FAS1) repeats